MRLFPNRKYDPAGRKRWIFWEWCDIPDVSNRERTYLSRLVIVRTPLFSVLVNRIRMADADRHLHDHPWSFFSILLRGWYIEERPLFDGETGFTRLRKREVRDLYNYCSAEQQHRIAQVSEDCLTLVFCGPKRRKWGFVTEYGWVDWQTYLGR